MYAELELEISSDLLTYRNSSNLQGVIMETIPEEYAALLHQGHMNPYSQFLLTEQERKRWFIRTMNKEAYENLLLPMKKLDEFSLKSGQISARITERTERFSSEDDLVKEFFDDDGPHNLEIRFLSPTAFKKDGRYVIYPDLKLIYGSLTRRFNTVSEAFDMTDPEMLEQLVSHSQITRYYLRTVRFPLEGVSVAGFTGTLGLYIHGADALARYARMLFRFGQFSGVGIKTGMGMGAIQLAEQGDSK